MTYIALSNRERGKLEQVVAHSPNARQVKRAYALLWLDNGEPFQEIAARLGVVRQTVYNWASGFRSTRAWQWKPGWLMRCGVVVRARPKV